MTRNWQISRRTVLRGMGVSMALPMLDAMGPGAGEAIASTGASPAAAAAPRRMAYIFIPNGVNMDHWRPRAAGAGFDLPPTLEPLAPVKDELLVLTGLAQRNGFALGDGPGDHARASASFLTGAHPNKTAGADIRNGISVDQFAAQRIGGATRLPSIELGCDRSRSSGNCDSGYSCAYVTNISWRTETTPMPKQTDPAAVFERLFGSAEDRRAAADQAKRLHYRRSILDAVLEQSNDLRRGLGVADRRKLDEFQSSVREIERRIDQLQNADADIDVPEDEAPEGPPGTFAEHQRLMYDMMLLAFRMDLTRIGTFMVSRAGSGRSYPEVGVHDNHHQLSHHRNREQNIAKIRKIDRFNVEQFAYFLQRLRQTPEGEGTLLDNCMVMLGSGISDGNRHNHNDLPILLAGRGGGTIDPGRHVRYAQDTPLCNLFCNLLDRMDVETDRFGDSTGRLRQLTV